MRYEKSSVTKMPQLILGPDDLRAIGDLTSQIMTPNTVRGMYIDPYKYIVALRTYFISYGVPAPFEVDLSAYPPHTGGGG